MDHLKINQTELGLPQGVSKQGAALAGKRAQFLMLTPHGQAHSVAADDACAQPDTTEVIILGIEIDIPDRLLRILA